MPSCSISMLPRMTVAFPVGFRDTHQRNDLRGRSREVIVQANWLFVVANWALIHSSLTIAASFDSTDAYFRSFLPGAPTYSATARDRERIAGVVQWPCEINCLHEAPYVASIFVLAIDQRGRLTEQVRSRPFAWQGSSSLESIEIEGEKIVVWLHHYSPTGQTRFTFIHRGDDWLLAGRDIELLRLVPEHGDEAVGDTRDQQSTDFLIGKIVETHYRANRWSAENSCRFPKLLIDLRDADLFSDDVLQYCR